MITKKEFKEKCSFHKYGRGKNKINAIYFDWQNTEFGTGFRFMVSGSVDHILKSELFEVMYKWVRESENNHESQFNLPWYVNYRYAVNDCQRFNVPLSM